MDILLYEMSNVKQTISCLFGLQNGHNVKIAKISSTESPLSGNLEFHFHIICAG